MAYRSMSQIRASVRAEMSRIQSRAKQVARDNVVLSSR